MKKISLLLALCLMLSIFSGCGNAQPAETTTAPVTTEPTETTEEVTVPVTTLPEPEVIDFDLTLPEGFAASVVEDGYFAFASPNAPRDSSCITVEVLPMDESVLAMTAEDFEAANEIVPPETTEPAETEETEETEETTEPIETEPEQPTAFKLLDFQDTEVDGWPAILAEYSLTYSDYICHIYRYEVVVNYANYVFTFIDSTDANQWLDAYVESAETIDLILNVDDIELNYSHLTWYDLKGGLGLYAEDGLETQKASCFTACLGDRNVIILVMADDKVENNLTELTLSDYAELVSQTNDLDGFKKDSYGNLLTTFYSSDDNGLEYYNTIVVKETMDSFWVCQMACLANDQAAYAREFCLWASSIQGE